MRFVLDPKYRKYVKSNGFLPFARKFGDKYGKKVNGYYNKDWNRCCKTCF